MIDQSTIDKIQETAEIVEVISDFTPLKKKGANYWACCPFHGEKTPSLSVSDSKQIFKCFGCGVAGDSVKFVMEHEGMGYIEALKYLADKYGIEIIEKEKTDEQLASETKKDSLYIVLNYAKTYYKQQLLDTDQGIHAGLAYFEKRGFSKETIEKFDLGYSPKEWSAFTEDALSKGYNLSYLEETGLTIVKEDGKKQYDRFRDRVLFPIHNLSGKVIGFGGRILTEDKKQPKYVNSPETEVYHKSNILYGIYQAKTSIRKEENCFLVEGYTDVVSLHQGGVENVVASSGTSLTTEQIRLIKRYSENLTLLFDGDAAGQRAALRGLDMVLEEGMNVKVLAFPDGEDPDSYIKKVGGEAFTQYIKDNSDDFIHFKSKLLLVDVKDDPIKRTEAVREIVKSLAVIEDSLKRTFYVKECAKIFEIEESVVIAEINKIRIKGFYDNKSKIEKEVAEKLIEQPKKEQKHLDFTSKTSVNDLEIEIIRLLLNFSSYDYSDDEEVVEFLLEQLDGLKFESEFALNLIEVLKSNLKKGKIVGMNSIVSELKLTDADQSKLIDMNMSKWDLSEGWKKNDIIVFNEFDIPKPTFFHVIHKLKWKRTCLMLDECLREIQQTNSEEELSKLQRKYTLLKQAEKEFANLFGNILR